MISEICLLLGIWTLWFLRFVTHTGNLNLVFFNLGQNWECEACNFWNLWLILELEPCDFSTMWLIIGTNIWTTSKFDRSFIMKMSWALTIFGSIFRKPERTMNGKIRVSVNVVGKGRFRGIGRNYRIAKSAAAKRALKFIRLLQQHIEQGGGLRQIMQNHHAPGFYPEPLPIMNMDPLGLM